jgi:hypothetical protein
MHGLLKKLVFVLLLVIGCFVARAQQHGITSHDKQLQKPVLRFIASTGVLAGASDRQVQVQVVSGLQFRQWQVGIGTGIDYYYFRGVPVFADVRRTFSKSHAFFSYANIGLHVPWVKELDANNWYRYSYKTGLYYDLGAGWQVKTGAKTAVLFSAGYSGKTIAERISQRFITDPSLTMQPIDSKYNLRRISIKAGFQF